MAKAEDYIPNVNQYTTADEDAVAGIVKHCGIALRNRDAAKVATTDKSETDRVRDSFLKKKLARTESDEELDAAVKAVCDKMTEDKSGKCRVTLYYLLAEHFEQLDMFK